MDSQRRRDATDLFAIPNFFDVPKKRRENICFLPSCLINDSGDLGFFLKKSSQNDPQGEIDLFLKFIVVYMYMYIYIHI